MGSFGERLRREREMRKISLDEIAAATKIGTRSLRALEDEEFGKLPGGIFNKGFVRAYARFLGVNEEQAVSDYLAAAGEPENATSDIDASQLITQHQADNKAPKVGLRALESINESSSGFPWLAVLALIFIVAAGSGGWKIYSHYKARAQQIAVQAAPVPQPAQAAPLQAETPVAQTPDSAAQPLPTPSPATQQSAATPAQVPTSQTQAVPEVAAPSAENGGVAEGFVLSIRATKDSWVSVMADGKTVMNGTLHPADEKSIRARDTIVLKTGNAGGVEIALNGKPLNPIGRDNEVRRVTISADGSVQ